MDEPDSVSDLLYGMPAIAGYLKVRPRQAYHLYEKCGAPCFHLGGKVCARKSSLDAWLSQRENDDR